MIMALKLKFVPTGLIFFFSFSCLFGCTSNHYKPMEARPSLANLEQLQSGESWSSTKVSALRGQALRETALSVGARGGLNWRANQINLILLRHEKILYRVFNFNAMMLDKSVLPPIIIEARNTLNLAGDDVIRIADRNFQILNQAKFVTAPPTWRDFLWMSFSPPDIPDKSLLPRSGGERIIWKRYIEEGWAAGIGQANAIFRENIGRLKRDFEGMIRYRTLLAQNIVSPPFVAEMDMGITGGGSGLTVRDRVLRITALPSLQNDSSNWKTELIPDE